MAVAVFIPSPMAAGIGAAAYFWIKRESPVNNLSLARLGFVHWLHNWYRTRLLRLPPLPWQGSSRLQLSHCPDRYSERACCSTMSSSQRCRDRDFIRRASEPPKLAVMFLTDQTSLSAATLRTATKFDVWYCSSASSYFAILTRSPRGRMIYNQ